MCGVTAAFAYSGSAAPIDRAELRAVRDHMRVRGPDGSGEWFSADGRVGLGHRRLAIIDLSEGGAQPMASADGALVISYNGEIYNYRELKADLQARGRVFTSESDTEVLLHLYAEYGVGMLSRLRGMFAFALWDGRKREMLLARDPMGIKPLYYADDGRTLRAASQVKALLRAPVDTRPSAAGHAGFLLWGSVPCPWTLYRGILGLPAGHFMWVGEQGATSPQPYCLVSDVLAQASANPAEGSEAQALDHITEALRNTTATHLVSDVPVGVFLSAGLDSAMLASIVAGQGTQARTLTLGFAEYAGTANDEVPLAEVVARHLGTQHSTVEVHRIDFESERQALLSAMDQPSLDGINTWFVARAAASRGIRVALSGLGGDEIFGSYPSFRQVPLLSRLAAPFGSRGGLGTFVRRLSEPLVRRMTSPKYAGLLEYGGTLGGAYLLRRGLYMPWELPRLMDPDMARDGWSDLQQMVRLDATTSGIRGAARQRLSVSALEMGWYMRNQLLRDADWAGMAHSIEIRVPLVDIAFIKAVAPWIAAHPSITKKQVAQAVARLPQELLDKPKTGFTVPVRQWLAAPSTSTRGLREWARYVHKRSAARLPSGASRSRRAAAPRVLVSTMAPGHGGVSAMTNFVVRNLEARGLEPVLAHYAPYSIMPDLSVPSFSLLRRRIGHRQGEAYGRHENHAIGAWLPELEFTHYAATAPWKQVMDSCDAFISVSGNALAATPFLQTGRPYLAWVATDWQGDRVDRVKNFPLVRRMLDTCVNGPVIRRLEKRLIASGTVLSLSEYTAKVLGGLAGPHFEKVILPVGVDASFFQPRAGAVVPGRLGFAGRFTDPRKHIELLLEAVAQLRAAGHDVHALLMGDVLTPELAALVKSLGLEGFVDVKSGLSREEMRDELQTLDVFVLPSHQEGLCIAALEAMACGAPVVSTRCGGPEEFIIPGRTGELVEHRVDDMVRAVAAIVGDRGLRARMGDEARHLVRQRYSRERVEAIFTDAFKATFPELGGHRMTYDSTFIPVAVNDTVAT
ncbi:MAG TPA: asparagine synthase (glutamine-hydrolyzing) [Ramlibacter sp.]|nr:asparagine synthase (glutamine-hydrolyzing) [Ramlibacter sp.]